jgi:hypothetical protein
VPTPSRALNGDIAIPPRNVKVPTVRYAIAVAAAPPAEGRSADPRNSAARPPLSLRALLDLGKLGRPLSPNLRTISIGAGERRLAMQIMLSRHPVVSAAFIIGIADRRVDVHQ